MKHRSEVSRVSVKNESLIRFFAGYAPLAAEVNPAASLSPDEVRCPCLDACPLVAGQPNTWWAASSPSSTGFFYGLAAFRVLYSWALGLGFVFYCYGLCLVGL